MPHFPDWAVYILISLPVVSLIIKLFKDRKKYAAGDINKIMAKIVVMYSDSLIAWIRSNGFYSDIKVGASDEKHIDVLGSHLGDIVWKQ